MNLRLFTSLTVWKILVSSRARNCSSTEECRDVHIHKVRERGKKREKRASHNEFYMAELGILMCFSLTSSMSALRRLHTLVDESERQWGGTSEIEKWRATECVVFAVSFLTKNDDKKHGKSIHISAFALRLRHKPNHLPLNVVWVMVKWFSFASSWMCLSRSLILHYRYFCRHHF